MGRKRREKNTRPNKRRRRNEKDKADKNHTAAEILASLSFARVAPEAAQDDGAAAATAPVILFVSLFADTLLHLNHLHEACVSAT